MIVPRDVTLGLLRDGDDRLELHRVATATTRFARQIAPAAYCGEACPASSMRSQPIASLPRSPNMRLAEAKVVDTSGTTRKKSCQAARSLFSSTSRG